MVKKVKKNKVKKNTQQLANGVTATFDPYRFPTLYKDWQQKTRAFSLKRMGNTGNTKLGDAQNVYEWLRDHVKLKRPKSKNTVGEGVNKILSSIERMIEEKKTFGPEELDVLEGFEIELEGILEDETLNPANIVFTELKPEAYRKKKNGEVVIDDPDNTREVYGHYRTKVYEDLNGDKAVKSSYYKYEKFQARPPLWLALFGVDNEVCNLGLLPLVRKTIEEIKNQELEVEISSAYINSERRARYIASISPIRRAISGLLRTKRLYDKNIFDTKTAAQMLSQKKFKLKGKDLEKVQDRFNILGDVEVSFEITPKALKLLIPILDSYSRTSNFANREIDGEKVVYKSKPVQIRSWTDILKVR